MNLTQHYCVATQDWAQGESQACFRNCRGMAAPAAQSESVMKENERCRAVTAISDHLYHPGFRSFEIAVRALGVLSRMAKEGIKP